MSNLILCGFTCSGKTTLGKKLASKLHLPFIDTDEEIGGARQFYLLYGEQAFREKESQIIKQIDSQKKQIISLGGGSLDKEENAVFLKQVGVIIYLNTPFAELFDRLCKRGLPAYADPFNPESSLEKLFNKRHSIYQKWADLHLQMEHLSIDQALTQLNDYMSSRQVKSKNRITGSQAAG